VSLEHFSLGDSNDPSIQRLKMLEGPFVWEARSLWFVAVGVPACFLYEPAWGVFALLTGPMVAAMVRPRICSHILKSHHGRYTFASRATRPGHHHRCPNYYVFLSPPFTLLAQDTVFSCVVTALFVRPIFKVFGEVRDVRSAGRISLERTKWLTLLGASLSVISSTSLCINCGLFVVLGDYGKPFYANPCLNPLAFGVNLDSVLNDVGVLLARGAIKKITCKTLPLGVSRFSLFVGCRHPRRGISDFNHACN
jgi:hypothetical protein